MQLDERAPTGKNTAGIVVNVELVVYVIEEGRQLAFDERQYVDVLVEAVPQL